MAKVIKNEKIIKNYPLYLELKNMFDIIRPTYKRKDEYRFIEILKRHQEEYANTDFYVVYIKDISFEFVQKDRREPMVTIKQ